MNVTEAQRVRLAIAFVALKHKPKDLSVSAYVLDLRDKFPLPKERSDLSGEPWRDRALNLEEEVNKLKRKHAEDLAELSVLRDSVRADKAPAKKKGKMKAAREELEGIGMGTVSLLQTVRNTSEELRTEIAAPELTGALDLFGSYHRLYQLSSALRSQSTASYSTHLRQLISSATNVFRALARTLDMTLCSENCLTTSLGFLNDFHVILCSALSCTVSLLPMTEIGSRKKAQRALSTHEFESVDALLAVLSCDILVPLIKLFSRLSEAALVPVLITKRQKKEAGADTSGAKAVLHGLLAVLKGAIMILKGSPSSHIHKVLDLVKLSVVSEIERLWEPPEGKSAGDGSLVSVDTTAPSINHCILPMARRPRKERIHQLARKNALWYLCSIAHDVFSLPPSSRSEDGSTSDATLERLDVTLSRLLVRCADSLHTSSSLEPKGTVRMDDVEKGMIASVIENIWLCQ